MSYELGFAVFFFFIYLSIIIVTVFNYVCVSAFEQGHLDPWRSKSALIIIIIIITWYSIIRKVDKIVNRGDDITVCLPGAKVEDIAEKARQVMGGGTGGAVLVHVGTNNADKEGTSAIIGKYRRLIKTLKEARVGQIVLSGILPIMGGRGEEYRNCRRIGINTQVQKVCMEEGGFVDMWLNFVGRGDFFMRDGLHLTGKGAAVLACEFVRVVDEGTGTIDYLN